MTVRPALALALAALCFGAGGCISLLPKTKPAQLYRFDYAGPAAEPCAQAGAVGVVVGPPLFPREAGTDQLLSMTGSQAAYIAETRWAAPAISLFQDAVEHAFQGSCAVRLVRRQDFGAGAANLRLDVDRFEVDYPTATATATATASAAPTAIVTLKATLLTKGGDFAAERFFTGSQVASDNRVGPIVSAYSAASTQALTALRGWTEANVAQVAAREAQADAPVVLPPTPPRLRVAPSRATPTSAQERQVAP